MKIDYIELRLDNNGQIEYVYPALIKTSKDLILVDTGYPGMIDQIDDKLKEKGFSLSELTQVWLTHHDHDHVGSLKDIKERHPHIIVKSSHIEKPYIDGTEKPMRLTQALSLHDGLSDEEKVGSQYFMDYLNSIEVCDVDGILEVNSKVLDDQIEIIETVGHTIGHVSLYHRASKTLISGDALVIIDEEVVIPFPEFAYDAKKASEACMILSEYDIERIILYHGKEFESDVNTMKDIIVKASEY